MNKIFVLLIFFSVLTGAGAEVFISEEFSNTERWEALTFPKIQSHTVYSIEEGQYLKIESDSSASGLIMTDTFDVYKFPLLTWRWKAMNIFEKGDARRKKGDDYPVRIYVVFEYDPDLAGFGQRLQYESVKLIYGEYPPLASISYIWSNRIINEDFIYSPYTKKAVMIPVESGSKNLGTWQSYSVNILDDYRKIFGTDPPKTASLAIMGDSDNTGEASLAYIDYIRLESE